MAMLDQVEQSQSCTMRLGSISSKGVDSRMHASEATDSRSNWPPAMYALVRSPPASYSVSDKRPTFHDAATVSSTEAAPDPHRPIECLPPHFQSAMLVQGAASHYRSVHLRSAILFGVYSAMPDNATLRCLLRIRAAAVAVNDKTGHKFRRRS